MKEVFKNIIKKLEDHCKEDCGSDCCLCDFRKSIEIVKQAATEYSNGWIPCSVEMPKVENLHEISIDNCTGYLVQRRCGLMDVAHYISVYGEHYFEANALKLSDVIAWQPLPDPYQPKGEMYG